MTTKKKVLHVGCGIPNPDRLHIMFHSPEWHEVRLDIDPNVKPDIVGDMLDLNMIEDSSMDAVWSSHNLEHLFSYQVPQALSEFLRVLKPGGFLITTMPDLQAVCAYVAKGHLEEPITDVEGVSIVASTGKPISPLDIIYGLGVSLAKGKHYMAHKSGFTPKSLKTRLESAGFSNIDVQTNKLDLWARAFKAAA